MKWKKWHLSLPKSNSDILTNFATTADFGKKGGRSKGHSKHGKHKKQGNMGFHNATGTQSEFGEKGGEVSRGSTLPPKEGIIWEKRIAEPIE